MEMASTFNLIHSSLKELRNQWDIHIEKQHSGGLMERAHALFNPNCDHELVRSVCGSIRQLDKDWSFLKMFVESISVWSDADQVIQKKNSEGESLVLKIEAVAMEIGKDLRGSAKYYSRPRELLNLLGDCQRKTHQDHLKAEIGQVLQYLSDITFTVYSTDYCFWNTFIVSARQNLQSIMVAFDGSLDCNQVYAALCNELNLIGRYLHGVSVFVAFCPSNDREDVDAFITHVASVVLKIANQSCNLWFNRTDPVTELVDLHHQIEPTNPDFLDLILRFQQVLYKTSGYDRCVDFFCSYILPWGRNPELQEVLCSLVRYLMHCCKEKDGFSREDVHSCSQEVKAVLAEAAFLHDAMRKENLTHHLPPPCSELLKRCFLLDADLFLKKQLMISLSLLGELEVKEVKSLELFEELSKEAASLHESLLSKKITESMVKHSLLQRLFKKVFFKAESFLTELLKSTSETSIAYEKDQIESLLQDLKHVKRIVTLMLLSNSRVEDKFFIQVEAVARMITVFSYSSLPISDKLKKMILSLPQLLDKVKHIKAKLREISQLFPKSNFPKTCELGFIEFLGRNLRELLKRDPKSIASVKHHIQEVQLHLDSFKSFLVKVLDVEQGELKDLGNRVIDVAYKIEYVVESIEVEAHFDHFDQREQLFFIYYLLQEMRLMNQQISKIHEMSYAGRAQNLPQTSHEMISRETTPVINEILIELDDQEEVIIQRLTRGSLERCVVSIVGMPGIGKTTLAKKVYNSQNARYHFHRLAWCTVSQVYSKRELLLEILSDIHGLTDEIHRMTIEHLESKMRQCLLGNNYLIVMDDVWDIAAWYDLQISFPDDNRGSRILVTSRCWDVVSKMKPGSDPHWIRQLSDDESWILLEKKIFKGECCPEDLLLVGKEISQHCEGLPLAVVAIAGLLQKTEKRVVSWKRISKSLSSPIINDPENRCMGILELSYKHLPDHLKACFLYLGVFLEDKDIPVNKLMQFWQAEGFIQKADSKSLEDAAEDCLMDLINRSLVMISKTRSNGKIKACRLHDLLRDLCHSKAKEENFLQQVNRYDEPYASFCGSDYGMEFDIYSPVDPVTFESYRLCIYLKRNHFIDSRPSGLETRSLIFFACIDSEPRCPYDISSICHNFKLLRVLDLESINMGVTFPAEIGVLVQLRYLAVSGYVQSIPPSISNLWKLETLIVKVLRGKVMLPKTIWSMASLRHLHVNNHVAFNLKGHEHVGSSLHLDNLVSFSTPSLSYGEDTMNIFWRLLNLHTMKCIFLESWDSSRNCNRFPILNFLTHLESIKIIYHGKALNSGEFVLPLNLKKLTLSNFRLPWNHISMIGRLPNLRVLKLSAGAFEGQRWDMKEEEFKELKFLKLDTLNIAEWNASADHLPRLERLVLRNCKDLEKIPNDFVDITTLQTIEVQWCGQSVEESAKEIGDATGEEIKVLISHS